LVIGWHGEKAAHRVVGYSGECGGRNWRKTILDPLVAGRKLVGGDGVRSSEGQVPVHPEEATASSGGVVKNPKASSHHGVSPQLIREAEARGKQLPLGMNANVRVGIEAGNENLAGQVV